MSIEKKVTVETEGNTYEIEHVKRMNKCDDGIIEFECINGDIHYVSAYTFEMIDIVNQHIEE